jgi:hypothetical protein
MYTTKNNYTEEREYDEIRGKSVYGWSEKTGEIRYNPKIGLLKRPPKYKNAGKKWKEILNERWDQQSYWGGEDGLDKDKFDGTFQRRIDRTRNWVLT